MWQLSCFDNCPVVKPFNATCHQQSTGYLMRNMLFNESCSAALLTCPTIPWSTVSSDVVCLEISAGQWAEVERDTYTVVDTRAVNSPSAYNAGVASECIPLTGDPSSCGISLQGTVMQWAEVAK